MQCIASAGGVMLRSRLVVASLILGKEPLVCPSVNIKSFPILKL